MKKRVLVIATIFCTIICIYLIIQKVYGRHLFLSRMIETNIPLSSNLEYKDTHGGFHMDGETFAKVYFSEEQANKFINEISENEHWRKLPMLDNLEESMSFNFNDEMNMPIVKNGYWFFIDRHSEANDKYNESEMFEEKRFSSNYTVAIFDEDTNTLYYYQVDT